ncbi:MAG: hypothetical protein IT303_11640 [Dehalococcoidia bacterium]|nr:hypothetical protein [Dehalococcoidia bacterium]
MYPSDALLVCLFCGGEPQFGTFQVTNEEIAAQEVRINGKNIVGTCERHFRAMSEVVEAIGDDAGRWLSLPIPEFPKGTLPGHESPEDRAVAAAEAIVRGNPPS